MSMQIVLQNKSESLDKSGDPETHSCYIARKGDLVAVRIGKGSGQATTLMNSSEALIVALGIAREARSIQHREDPT